MLKTKNRKTKHYNKWKIFNNHIIHRLFRVIYIYIYIYIYSWSFFMSHILVEIINCMLKAFRTGVLNSQLLPFQILLPLSKMLRKWYIKGRQIKETRMKSEDVINNIIRTAEFILFLIKRNFNFIYLNIYDHTLRWFLSYCIINK